MPRSRSRSRRRRGYSRKLKLTKKEMAALGIGAAGLGLAALNSRPGGLGGRRPINKRYEDMTEDEIKERQMRIVEAMSRAGLEGAPGAAGRLGQKPTWTDVGSRIKNYFGFYEAPYPAMPRQRSRSRRKYSRRSFRRKMRCSKKK